MKFPTHSKCPVCEKPFTELSSRIAICRTEILMTQNITMDHHYSWWSDQNTNGFEVGTEFYFFKNFRVTLNYNQHDQNILISAWNNNRILKTIMTINHIVPFSSAEHLEKKIKTYLTFQ